MIDRDILNCNNRLAKAAIRFNKPNITVDVTYNSFRSGLRYVTLKMYKWDGEHIVDSKHFTVTYKDDVNDIIKQMEEF